MTAAIQYMKNRVQCSSNLVRIHNYSYYTDRVIGSGNFSTVYEAFSHTTHNKIASKIVKMSSLTFKKLEQLLQQQIQILLSLDHMNTIKCYDVLKTQQQCHIFTQFCEGGTLDKNLKERGPLNEEQAWPFIKGIYEGLKYLSSKNIIHRDLKPANIFLKGETVKIADFGFAVKAKERFQDMNIGSPFYMAPEAFINNIYGSKTDVWSFGIIIYELLHGKTPFFDIHNEQGLKQRIVVPIKREDIKPEISYELRELILRCLQIEQTKRISVEEIANTYFMRKKSSGLLYSYPSAKQNAQTDTMKSQLNRYGTHAVIRIPGSISIKDRDGDNLEKENRKPQGKSYYQLLKARSQTRINQLNKINSSSLETNPQSPYLTTYRPTVYKTSVYRLKDEIKEDKKITYGGYLKLQNNNRCDNPTITIK